MQTQEQCVMQKTGNITGQKPKLVQIPGMQALSSESEEKSTGSTYSSQVLWLKFHDPNHMRNLMTSAAKHF